jgi:phage tail-like protein
MDDSNRRDFIKTVAVGGAALVAVPSFAFSAATVYDKKLFSKYFKVEVKGMYGTVPGVVEVDAGRVTVSVEECTQGDKPEYRTYTYGAHDYEDFTMTVQQGPGMVKLQKWADKAMKVGGSGDALRRDISIYALARDKSTVLKTFNCFGCFPVGFDAGSHSTESDIKTIKLTCNIDRIEVA